MTSHVRNCGFVCFEFNGDNSSQNANINIFTSRYFKVFPTFHLEFSLLFRFALQENLASGFQSLFDRGDLVDVTLACDGKLLQAHKIVLAICSPYFQDMFVTNPCRHPISESIRQLFDSP